MSYVFALAVFFASGFAALVYQVVWQRMLAIFSGVDVYSATLIVAAFMGGLGVGHMGGGYAADRVSPRTSLLFFAIAELAVAGFGLASSSIYYDFLYQSLGATALPRAALAAVLFASLLWPTFWMGASLPLLARGLTRDLQRAPAVVGLLYGVNTLGAAAGALWATWSLLPRLGLDGALMIGVALNVACAICVIPVAFRQPDDLEAPASNGVDTAVLTGAEGRRLSFWVTAYAISGFIALSLEILWFRLLGVMMKSSAFTFGTLLAIYLTGIALGAIAGAFVARRVKRPAVTFFALQAAAGLSAALLLTLLVATSDEIRAFRGYFASYEPIDVRDSVDQIRRVLAGDRSAGIGANFVRMYIGLPLLLILPPTLLMGCSFPVLQRLVHTDLARVGRSVGILLMANVAGSMLGALLTGWLLLRILGTAGTLQFLATLCAGFAALALAATGRGWRAPRTVAWSTVVVLAVLAIFIWTPDGSVLWARLHGSTVDASVVAEDETGVSVIKRGAGSSERIVLLNGLGQSTIPFNELHIALGAMPAFIHPAPKDVLIIGLGSGATTYGAGGVPGIERIACIEIVRPQLATLRRAAQDARYPALTGLLADSRIEHIAGDGRAFVMRGGRSYDIIEADALRASSAYSGNLYSVEYFRLLRDRLRPGGFAATWTAAPRVANSFMRVFPHVVSLPGILIGSSQPIAVDRAAIRRAAADPGTVAYYRAAGIEITAVVERYLRDLVIYGPDAPRDPRAEFNTDLFPRDEYDLTPPLR